MRKATIKRAKSKAIKKTLFCENQGRKPGPSEIDELMMLYGQGRTTEVEVLAGSFTQRFPGYGFGWKMLGAVLHHHECYEDAIAATQKATKLLPNDAEAHSNLGFSFISLGRFVEAEASCRRAIEIDSDSFFAHYNLGFALYSQGKLAEASFRQAMAINPGFAQVHSNLLFCLTHNEAIDAMALLEEHCCFARKFEAPLKERWPQHCNSQETERCLQIGFVSGDLYDHAVATFIEPVLAYLSERPQLTLRAYYNHTIEDEVTRRLRGHLHHWHPVAGLTDEALAEKIRNDRIDILVDLSGHTPKNRLLTFARKPAPVQVSWMGYPGTTGLSGMDYYLADRFLLPPGQFDHQFTEKIVRLPACAPYQPNSAAPSVNALPALTNGYITFGSFNRPSKLSPSVISLWSQLLRALPDSRIVMGCMPPDGKHDELIDWFAKESITQERLSFYSRCSVSDYFALHQQVDICLDTFPYNGGTTTLNALWMGLPTLTLEGKTVTARQGATILSQMGLNAFIAQDAEDFVRKGLSWAKHPSSLAELRA
ncbi:MAG: O-linked N-acetylglucosamine transferase, SPINDLY family protein, partial [Methylobacter sp.]